MICESCQLGFATFDRPVRQDHQRSSSFRGRILVSGFEESEGLTGTIERRRRPVDDRVQKTAKETQYKTRTTSPSRQLFGR